MAAERNRLSDADIEDLAGAVTAGDRRALARAITLVESRRDDHRDAASKLVTHILPHTGQSIRLGITGVPGVGKSTFIEAFGLHVLDAGHRVAVLAIDPTSRRSGGSILGDKTRMERLIRSDDVFVRPSPAGETLGGVARRTREAMLLCEAAGYDLVLVETVGVGQSETSVADMVDMFLLLLVPGGGDELQGIKRGIMELADLLIVNKADGDLVQAAGRAAADYSHALQLLRPLSEHWRPEVLQTSAITGDGLEAVWGAIIRYRDIMVSTGAQARRRSAQAQAWMWSDVTDTLLQQIRGDTAIAAQARQMEAAVADGRLSPGQAARSLLSDFYQLKRDKA